MLFDLIIEYGKEFHNLGRWYKIVNCFIFVL